MIGLMTEDEIEEMLDAHRVGRLGCSANDRPYVIPINYRYACGDVFGCALAGRMIDILREQPLACFEIDEIDDRSGWRCVVAEGVYQELTDDRERGQALALLDLSRSNPSSSGRAGENQFVVFRVRLHEKSGRFQRSEPWTPTTGRMGPDLSGVEKAGFVAILPRGGPTT